MNMSNVMQLFQVFRQNPMQFLLSRGMNVPQNIQNDPNAIIQYMLNNGQISQQQYNQAAQMARQFQNQMR
jgi:predicted amidophosphoribosyltransferase